jgi:predicted ester cyclase
MILKNNQDLSKLHPRGPGRCPLVLGTSPAVKAWLGFASSSLRNHPIRLYPAKNIFETHGDLGGVRMAQEEENLAALEKKLAAAASSGNLVVLDEVFAPNVVDHDPAPDQEPGPDGYKRFFSGLRAAFPDLTVTVDHLVQTGTDIAIACTIRGAHRGEFSGIAPTGRPINARGMQIARFEDDMIVERWGSADESGKLLKLGAKVSPG